MKMDAVTYLNEAVVETLSEHFVCAKLNQTRAAADVVAAMRPAKLMWTPSFIFQDHRGIEVRRSVGFLPPDEFNAELLCVLGLIDLLQVRNQTAFERLEQVRESFPDTSVAPETIFWAGVALFRQYGGDKEVLREYWENLQTGYPSSLWWTKVDVFDMLDQ